MGKNIVLIGFMGTGKSSVGSRLAERLGMKFVDMDREIEKVTGMTVSKIFRKHGEIRFRSEEQLLARKLGKQSGLVIATGGGVVLNPDNIEALRQNGLMIWLDAEAEIVLARVNRKKRSRPLIKKSTTVDDIAKMLQSREPYYACADLRIDTDNKELNRVVNEIIQGLKDMGYKTALALKPPEFRDKTTE